MTWVLSMKYGIAFVVMKNGEIVELNNTEDIINIRSQTMQSNLFQK